MPLLQIKTWGAGLIEPGACEDDPVPLNEAVQDFVGDSPFYSPPTSWIGYCGFNDEGFEGIEPLEFDRVYPVPGVSSIGYKIGPVGVGLYADYGFRSAFNLGELMFFSRLTHHVRRLMFSWEHCDPCVMYRI